MLASVTSAFDGLRYLHEIGEDRNQKFVKYPYERLVKELRVMDSQLAALQTVDRWTEEATDLRGLIAVVARSVADLRNKTVSGLVKFYHQFTTNGSAVPGDLLSKEVSRLQSAVAVLESGSGIPRPPAQVGFDARGHQLGSSAQLGSILARLAKTEADNALLTRELQALKAAPQAAPRAVPQVAPPSAPNPNSAFDLEARLTALEAAGDLESVTLGMQTFKNIQDCETFLFQHVPHDVLDAYAYDLVSMIHRIGRDGGAVQREHTANKAGFKNSGSATLFASFQQALPGPFGVGSATANSSSHPIPALKDFVTWDRQDGMTGLKTEITLGIANAATAILAAMERDCQNHPIANLLFTTMIQNSQLQWHQFAGFLSEKYMTSLHQIEDAKEAWLYTSEILKGVFSELHKIRAVAADRTSSIHNHRDAARSLWVALQTQQIMGEFIALKFTGHPKLSPYSINHLFRHRVAPKSIEALAAKVVKVENDLRSVTTLQQKMKLKYPL